MWFRLKILRCLLLPWPLIAPLLLLGRPPRAAHSLLHDRTKLLKRLGISSVHLLGHTTEILTGLNDVSIVAVQLVGITQHLHHTLHALRARRPEAHRTPQILQRSNSFQLIRMEIVGIGIKNGNGVSPFLETHFEYRFQHRVVLLSVITLFYHSLTDGVDGL